MIQQHSPVKQAQTMQPNWMGRVRALSAVLGVGAALMAAALAFDVRAESHCMQKHGADAAPAEMLMGPLGGQGKHTDRMYQRLNVTPEQKAQLQELAKAQKAERQAQHATHQALHKDMQAFLNQPAWDEAQEQTLRARALALHQDMAEKRWQHKMAMAKVLTPDQRKQAMGMMEKRMSRHQEKREKRGQGQCQGQNPCNGMNKAQ